MPHTDEALSLQAIHAKRVDNPHSTTGSQLGLGVLQSTTGVTAGTASGVATTIFTAPGTTGAAYLVTCDLNSAVPATYSAVALVTTDAGVARVTNLQTATLMSISISGLNIQFTQGSGAAQNVTWTVTRIA